MLARAAIQGLSTFSSTGSRPVQEDFTLAAREKGIFCVADGFGGAGAGAAAARAACESVRNFLEKEAGDRDATLPFVLRSYFSLVGNVLFNALIHANRKLLKLNHGKNVHEKGGASMVAGYLDGDLLALASVGDCSAWLIREGRSIELVTPRSYSRLMDPFTADPHPAWAFPLMAMGLSEDLEPEIVECRIKPGDWLLLHTDGLRWELREAIIRIHAEGREPYRALQEVEQVLKTSTSSDNLSNLLTIF